jgi:hypothetical protein
VVKKINIRTVVVGIRKEVLIICTVTVIQANLGYYVGETGVESACVTVRIKKKTYIMFFPVIHWPYRNYIDPTG